MPAVEPSHRRVAANCTLKNTSGLLKMITHLVCAKLYNFANFSNEPVLGLDVLAKARPALANINGEPDDLRAGRVSSRQGCYILPFFETLARSGSYSAVSAPIFAN